VTKTSKAVAALFLAGAVVTGVFLARGWIERPQAPAAGPHRGGELVATNRSEPTSFNRFTDLKSANELVSRLIHARLVRINRTTDALEPRLAERWTVSDDHLTYTLFLRRNVQFSDGVPFTSADVLFTFQAVYDQSSQMAGEFEVAGRPLQVSAPDDHTVVITFPSPYAPGLRMLDSLPILPRHKLEAALREGRLGQAWGPATPPADLAGLGPFVLAEYTPGQRMVFTRNPHYWRRDASGVQLPYLDRLVLDIVPDQNAEVLRLEAGQSDLMTGEARPEDIAAFRDAAAAGRLQLVDAGVSRDSNLLWINLRPDAKLAPDRRAWLQSEDFRKAISYAVDRRQFVNTVYLGAAVPIWGPVTPSFGVWYVPDLPTYPYDPARARTLLAGLGLADRNGDGMLDDRQGHPVRFSILTQQGVDMRERGAAVIQEQLRKVGVVVDVVSLDQGALFQRFASGDYDAMFYGVETSDSDPASNVAFWLSSGAFHFWNPGQTKPATEWEGRIDDLMRRQVTTIDLGERRALFAEVQRIFAEHVPALYFAAPEIYVAMSPRVANAAPVPWRPQVLWNADVLAVKEGGVR
jgi:peptide/nickel transport system substrate-binding protein